jgi:hypothetical protein
MDPVDRDSVVHWISVALDRAREGDLDGRWQALVRARSYAERGGGRVLLDTIDREMRGIAECSPALRVPERVRGVWWARS